MLIKKNYTLFDKKNIYFIFLNSLMLNAWVFFFSKILCGFFPRVDTKDVASEKDKIVEVTIDYTPTQSHPSHHHGSPPPRPSKSG